MRARARDGYTLVELVVTLLIVGILAAFAVPQYLNTVETGKADDAVAIVNMIGTTNKMFALDHGGSYVYGTFSASCGVGVCPASVSANVAGACTLVWCKYLADQDWARKPYVFHACDVVGDGGGAGCGNAGAVAGGDRNAAAYSPYSTWGYWMSTSGQITGTGTNVPPPTY